MFGVGWFDYWLFLGCIYLFVLAFQDVRSIRLKKKSFVVDARWNYVMVGLTVSLISHVKSINIWFLFGLIASGLVLNWALIKSKVFGRADVVSLNWIYFGFGIISFPLVLFFFMFLLFFGFVTKAVAKYVLKQDRIPFFPVIAGAFITLLLLMSIGGY